jgi:phospholipase/carboxylesterase
MVLKTFSTSKTPNRAVIAIHGWTGDTSSMEPVGKAMSLKDTKWILPQAPYTAGPGGFSWFDGDEEMGWKYQESFHILTDLIQSLNNQGFPNSDIFIISFSQGACLAMEFMIRQSFSLGGIIPIAGFIRYKKRVKQDATDASRNTPVLLLHGEKDKIILLEQSRISLKIFKDAGYKAYLHIFSSGHKIPLQAINSIKNFINNKHF